jgi:membrane-associated protein
MNTIPHSLLPLSPVTPIAILVVIAILIVVEMGLVFGFFLPGDFLLIAAGILAGSYSDISWKSVAITVAAASFIGSELGFFVGKRFGYVLTRNNNPPSIQKAIATIKRYLASSGWLTVLLGNFAPGLRAFIPIIAGQSGMNRVKYASANAFGSMAWASVLTFIGLKLASITAVQDSPFVIVSGLFLISSGASIVHYFRAM